MLYIYIWRDCSASLNKIALINHTMSIKYCFLVFVPALIFESIVVLCSSVHTCTLRDNSKKPLLERLYSLQGKRFEVENAGNKYSVAICSDASDKPEFRNVSVIKEKNAKTQILAFYNNTDILVRDSWLLLTYGNESTGNTNLSVICNSTRVHIMIICNSETDNHPLHFVEFNKDWSDTGGNIYMFELHSRALCPKEIEHFSNGSVFCIIFLTSVGLYLLMGIAYRRLIGGAKGLEQIPHYDFWKELGNLQADGCNFVCRCSKQEESWRRLTNNFNDPQDDAMLHP